jgi:hypothetical protein
VTAQKLLKKRCIGYLAYILNLNDRGPRLKDIPVVKEFPDVFPEELPGLPLESHHSPTTIPDGSDRIE